MPKFEQPEVPKEEHLEGPVEEIERIEKEQILEKFEQLEIETGSIPLLEYYFKNPKEKKKMDESLDKFVQLPVNEQDKKRETLEKLRDGLGLIGETPKEIFDRRIARGGRYPKIFEEKK